MRAWDLKFITETGTFIERVIDTIRLECMSAANKGRYHCEWYSPVGYDLTDGDINAIKEFVTSEYGLGDEGIKVTPFIFPPDKIHPYRSMKLKINWED